MPKMKVESPVPSSCQSEGGDISLRKGKGREGCFSEKVPMKFLDIRDFFESPAGIFLGIRDFFESPAGIFLGIRFTFINSTGDCFTL